MTQNGYGVPAGHIGKIPNFGKTQVNPMGYVEPPACIQNAMLTKDKKPFTYTPGGLDLSQIRTPSMARRMARQRSLEEQEQAQRQFSNGQANGGYVPPPPPPPTMPGPPPPPPLKIEVSQPTKPSVSGERPEIVIPENPIGMLRKTHSPYHWETEKAELERMGPVPKFTERVNNPLTVKMPSTFSQQPPQSYNSGSRDHDSPLHGPSAQYSNSGSPQANSSEPMRQFLQRQDSQFNKSPQPYGKSSPSTPSFAPSESGKEFAKNYSINSPSPQAQTNFNSSSPTVPASPPHFMKPSVKTPETGNLFHTLPRSAQRNQSNMNMKPSATNTPPPSPQINTFNATPWKQSLSNQNESNNYPKNNFNNNHQPNYSPPWANNRNEATFNDVNNRYPQNTSWESRDNNNNKNSPPIHEGYNQPRYQSTITIPVTPKKTPASPQNNTQKEIVYVTEEPVYYCPDSPKSVPPWLRTQKEKTKTPPPAWCQRPLDRVSATRDLITPPKEVNQEPEWVKRSNELNRTIRDVVSPPKYQESAQPSWSTIPSENRKSLPRENEPNTRGNRVIPIQIEGSNSCVNNGQPHLRISIGMPQNTYSQENVQAPYSQPTQRIMKVLSPTTVRSGNESPQTKFPSLSRNSEVQQGPKTRIIPIQIEGGNNEANKSFGGRY